MDLNELLIEELTRVEAMTPTCTLMCCDKPNSPVFEQLPAYSICLRNHAHGDADTISTVEIFAASHDGKKLLFFDKSTSQIGLIDSGCHARPESIQLLRTA